MECEVPTIEVFAKSEGSGSPDSRVFPAPFRHRPIPFTPAVIPITAAFAHFGVDCSSGSSIARTISASSCHSNSACCVGAIATFHHVARETSSATTQVRGTRGELKCARDTQTLFAYPYVSPWAQPAVASSANLRTNQKHRPSANCQVIVFPFVLAS